jgi:hypothetical protein
MELRGGDTAPPLVEEDGRGPAGAASQGGDERRGGAPRQGDARR